MRIDRRGAGLQPRRRRPPCSGDRLADYARRFNARREDFLPIRRVVAAVDAAPREVDDDVCAVDLALPITEHGAIPLDDAPWSDVRVTAEHHDIVAVAVKCARQHRSDLPRTTWNHDPRKSPACPSMKRLWNSGRGTRQRS